MTKAAERELAQISIYLARPDVEFEEAVDWEKAVAKPKFSQFDFHVGGMACRFIYFESNTPKSNPPWLDFANEQLPPEHRVVFSGRSRSANGLLGLKIDGRQLVAVFGRSAGALVRRKMVERDFGIRTAMNLCGNGGIRQTRTQSQSLTPTLIDRQVGQPMNSFVFGLSEAEDLKSLAAHLKTTPWSRFRGAITLPSKGWETRS